MVAEREGFEPPVPRGTPVFKTGVIDHSTISPIEILVEKLCGEDEIRTRGTLIRFVGLANRWFQPLTHLSKHTCYENKDYILFFRLSKIKCSGGRRWIRTTEVVDSRFTVCPIWPLWNTPGLFYELITQSRHRELNSGPHPYQGCALPLSYDGSICASRWA